MKKNTKQFQTISHVVFPDFRTIHHFISNKPQPTDPVSCPSQQ